MTGASLIAPALAMPTSDFHIVLDPGHGGSDEGTVYQGHTMQIAEKDMTLSLAFAVQKQLRLQGYRVTLTRESDQEIALPARTALANRLNADLFISIHMNSSQSGKLRTGVDDHEHSSPQGIETYILNHTSDAASKRLAHVENAVVQSGSPSSAEDPDIALILKDLKLDANFAASKSLACLIQRNLATPGSALEKHQNKNRGVKQALFHVLIGANMPSVLVEAGFLSHAQDRAQALSPSGQLQIGRAVTKAVQEFTQISPNKKKNQLIDRCKIN